MAKVLAFDPHRITDPHEARRFVRALRGAAYRYAWRYWRWRTRKAAGGLPRRPRSLLKRDADLISNVIEFALGHRLTKAPAVFVGWQEQPGGRPPVALYNLTMPLPGHPKGSTVSARTIIEAGYELPETPGAANPCGDPGLIWTGRNPRGSRARFAHERLEAPGRFDPRSLRTVRRGRTRIVVGCPKGHYHRGRCQVGTRAQAILRARNPVGDQLIINGVPYLVIAETQDREGPLLMVRRPKGVKEYLARRLPDSPLYGESRGVIVHALPRSRGNPEAKRPILDFITEAVTAELRGDPNAASWVFHREMSADDRLRFDLWLVKMKDPLAWEAGTTESRFYRRVRAMVQAERTRRGNPGMSAAARRRYPSIAKLHEDLAAVYRAALDRTGDPKAAQRAVDLYLAGQLAREHPPLKRNPHRRTRRRGGARLMYPAGRIAGTWYGRHVNGNLYEHRFGRGLKRIYSLPGGRLMIEPHRGRLWTTV